MKIYRRCEGIPEPEEKKEENPVKEQTIEMPKKEADTEAAQQEEKETQKKVERDEDGFILPQKRDQSKITEDAEVSEQQVLKPLFFLQILLKE